MSRYLLRASILRGVDRLVNDSGGNFSEVEQRTGLLRSWLEDNDALIPAAMGAEVLFAATESTGDPVLPIRLMSIQDTSIFGEVGLLFETARTLRQGIDAFLSFNQLHNPSLTWHLEPVPNVGELRLSPRFALRDTRHRGVIADTAMGHCWMICRQCSPDLRLIRVELKKDAGGSDHLYRSYYRAPVVYGAGDDCLVIKLSDWEKSLVGSNERIFELIRSNLSNRAGPSVSKIPPQFYPGQLKRQVEQLIRVLLQTGECSVDRVAELYHCDKRTLQRNLKAEASSYQEILDGVRGGLAQTYLRRPEISITQAAHLLGFSDASNFARAFSKLFDVSPREWRRRHGVSSTTVFSRRRQTIEAILRSRDSA